MTAKLCRAKGCEKPVKPGRAYCSKRCVYNVNVAKNTTPLPGPPKSAPVPSVGSWWTDADAFYARARERFPVDAPTKSCRKVETFGTYARDLLAIGRARLREQKRSLRAR